VLLLSGCCSSQQKDEHTYWAAPAGLVGQRARATEYGRGLSLHFSPAHPHPIHLAGDVGLLSSAIHYIVMLCCGWRCVVSHIPPHRLYNQLMTLSGRHEGRQHYALKTQQTLAAACCFAGNSGLVGVDLLVTHSISTRLVLFQLRRLLCGGCLLLPKLSLLDGRSAKFNSVEKVSESEPGKTWAPYRGPAWLTCNTLFESMPICSVDGLWCAG
jgi:hypothetical protein